jgi:hypothetical protein
MIVREARCACGALSARAEGDPARVSICYCGACKRRTGSAFSWNATYDAAQVEIIGASQSYTRDSEDGFWGRHHFCPSCAVGIWYEIERRPGMISIPAGAFADADFPPPRIDVYDELRCAWLPELGLPHE